MKTVTGYSWAKANKTRMLQEEMAALKAQKAAQAQEQAPPADRSAE